jgi:hypothetical protein
MGVRAIFYVKRVAETASGAGEMTLEAAAKGDYGKWSKWTPHGELTLTCLNDDATQWFRERLGKDVAIDFGDPTEADLAVE